MYMYMCTLVYMYVHTYVHVRCTCTNVHVYMSMYMYLYIYNVLYIHPFPFPSSLAPSLPLQELDAHLSDRILLVGSKLSLADLILYYGLHRYMVTWTAHTVVVVATLACETLSW